MSLVLNPYIHFRGEARDALTFYNDVFGGELAISEFGSMASPEDADKVMHGSVTTDDLTLMASDAPAEMEISEGMSVAISLSGDDADQLRGYWDKLSSGGQAVVPLAAAPWGDEYGQCIDKFGVTWHVNITTAGA